MRSDYPFNKDREGTMPDIDTDFSDKARIEIIEYLELKYGQESVKKTTEEIVINSKGMIF